MVTNSSEYEKEMLAGHNKWHKAEEIQTKLHSLC
jgi:hypothetical protein